MKTKDVIALKQQQLIKLNEESGRAIDLVASTINNLESVNKKIDSQIEEINKLVETLSSTEDGLNQTRLNNTKIIEKFRNLIEAQNEKQEVGLRNMRRVTKIKIIIFIVLVFLYNMLKQFVSRLIADELAMNQIQNTIDSN